MSNQKSKSEVVASLSFPCYAITGVSGRHVIVGGGGGSAKTGIKNQFDVFELYHNGKQTVGERVLSHEVGDYCISNMVGWTSQQNNRSSQTKKTSTISLSIGLEENCVLMKLKPVLHSLKADEPSSEKISKAKDKSQNSGQVRRRRGSEKNAEEGMTTTEEVKDQNEDRKRRKSANTTLRGSKYFSFDLEKVSSTETVNKKSPEDEAYQKCCRVAPDNKFLVTGGTDGHIRVWGLPNMNKMKEIKAHDHEVDDVDIKPDGKQIVSVSKPTRECCVWNWKDGKKFIHVVPQTNGVKYKCFRARYGVVEGDLAKTRLFTVSNPLTGSKNPAIVAKWCGRTYAQQKSQNLMGSLSSLAISDDGRYLATGTMGGTIYILISFSLQQLYVIEDAHSMFVTGLEWLPTKNPESQMVRGFSDASVLSISCDNSLKIHHIPRQGMIQVWVVAVLAAFVLFCTFLLASYLGL